MTDAEKPSEQPTAAETGAQPEPAKFARLEGEALHEALVKQIEFYFSRVNLSQDAYLVGQMDQSMYVPIATICNFKMMKSLTEDAELVKRVMRESKAVVLNSEETHVRPNFTNQRNTIILREIPSATAVDEVKALFARNTEIEQPHTVRSDIGDHWFVQFDKQADCLAACNWLRSQTFLDKPIQARVKSENILRGIMAAPQDMGYNASVPVTNAFFGNPMGYMGRPVGREMLGLVPLHGRRGPGGGQPRQPRNPAESSTAASVNGTVKPARKAKNAKSLRKDGMTGAEAKPAAEGDASKAVEVAKSRSEFNMAPTAFPPLPGGNGKKKESGVRQAGYQRDFKKYSREDMIELIKNLKSVARPETMVTDCPVVLSKANCDLEVDKPIPPPVMMGDLYGSGCPDSDDENTRNDDQADTDKASDIKESVAQREREAELAKQKEEVAQKKKQAAEKKAEATKTSYAAMLKSAGSPEKKTPAPAAPAAAAAAAAAK